MTAVLRPAAIEEIAENLRAAAAEGTAVTVRGSGSDRRSPDTPIVLSTEALSGVVDYKPDDLTLVVRAGTTLKEVDETLSPRGLSAVLPEQASHRTVGASWRAGLRPSEDSGTARRGSA